MKTIIPQTLSNFQEYLPSFSSLLLNQKRNRAAYGPPKFTFSIGPSCF